MTNNLAYKLKMAKQKAEKLLKDEGLQTLPINILALAESRGIVVQAKPDTADGVSGMLLRTNNDVFGILYATFINSDGFQRFSIAHELGHYFLEGHPEKLLPSEGFHESRAGFTSSDPYEMEADCFAAGLLMPENLFRKEMGLIDDGLEAIETLADKFQTSLTATAIRYAELTRSATAVIMTRGNVVDYCILSDGIKSLKGMKWIRNGSPLPPDTETARFNSTYSNISESKRESADIDVSSWFGNEGRFKAKEDIIGLGSYGRTLTIVTCQIEDDETDVDDEDDEEFAARWTPSFKR